MSRDVKSQRQKSMLADFSGSLGIVTYVFDVFHKKDSRTAAAAA